MEAILLILILFGVTQLAVGLIFCGEGRKCNCDVTGYLTCWDTLPPDPDRLPFINFSSIDFRDTYVSYFDEAYYRNFPKLKLINLDMRKSMHGFDCSSLKGVQSSGYQIIAPQCG